MTPRPKPQCTRRPPTLGLLLVAVALLAGDARAHTDLFPIAGDRLQLQDGHFAFRSGRSSSITPGHDPRVDPASLLLRGSTGRSKLVDLPGEFWTPIPNRDNVPPRGWLYSDPSGSQGGIVRVLFANRRLVVNGQGESLAWVPDAAQDEVWIHFQMEEEQFCAHFDGDASWSANGPDGLLVEDAAAPDACPEPVCGNGTLEFGEACDDGNLVDDDGCTNTCEIGDCSEQTDFASTYEAIQSVIFDNPAYGCTSPVCHGASGGFPGQGGLDLTAGASFAELMGDNGFGADSEAIPGMKRVDPGSWQTSLLYQKVANAAALEAGDPVPYPAAGTAMPPFGSALLPEHLDGLKEWILMGALETGVVEGTAQLFGACLPEPTPGKIARPDPPEPTEGFQLLQTPWDLPQTSENEICIATWYDLREVAPDDARIPCPEAFRPRKGCSTDNAVECTEHTECQTAEAPDAKCVPVKNTTNPTNECVAWHIQDLVQDPQSHHSIVHIYTGSAALEDPDWGEWTNKYQLSDPLRATHQGTPCDPTAIPEGQVQNETCSADPVVSIGCIGYGPEDFANIATLLGDGGNAPQVVASQQTRYQLDLADGAYSILPIQGVMVFNSHAFNTTPTDTTMDQYMNIEYAKVEDQLYPTQQIFDANSIFSQYVPPFEKREYCRTYTIPQHGRLFQLSSHTHRFGVRWRTWFPPNEPCLPGCPPAIVNFGCEWNANLPLCEDLLPEYGTDAFDVAVGPPDYVSTRYNDPLNLDLSPPLAYDSPNVEDRTFLYCAQYDNGSTETSPPVKRRSTSPPPPFGLPPEVAGGPCLAQNTYCVDGPDQGEACFGVDALCTPVNPGESPAGLCDACYVRGGVRTEDEMMILLGNFFVQPPAP